MIRKRTFIDSVRFWHNDLEGTIREADRIARSFGLSDMDSLHVAAAMLSGSDELVTTERATKPIHRVQGIIVTSVREDL